MDSVFRSSLWLIAALMPFAPAVAAPAQDADVAVSEAVFVPEALHVERGGEGVSLLIPRDELLRFTVTVDLGLFGKTKAGRVDLSAGVTPYRPELPAPGDIRQPAQPRYVGWLKSHAYGKHLGYELDHTLRARHLPQEFPSLFYLDRQKGSENRRRELRIGFRDGKHIVRVRRDGHCKGCESKDHQVKAFLPWEDQEHCRRCKRDEHRVWRQETERVIPEHAFDMLSAVYLAREFLKSGQEAVTFPIVDRKHVWTVTLKRGGDRSVNTAVGRFDCTAIRVETKAPEGEDASDSEFRGLFGMHGDVRIFVHAETGVPTLIEGTIPLGPLALDVEVRLESYRGTPAGFAPIEASAPR